MNHFDTHEVFNQAPPFENVNLFACDIALREALEREGGAAAADQLHALGDKLGSAATLDLGRQANLNSPRLQHFDRSGRRVDEVEFHPSWHALMALMIGEGVHASPWDSGVAGAQVARAGTEA
jgi:putative acyl-CoA dehydrogenase